MSLPVIYNVKQVAEYLIIDEETVYKLIRARELAARKVGNQWRIQEGDILEYLESKKVKRRTA